MVAFETEVIEVVRRTPEVKSFRFKSPGGADFRAGQFFFVTIRIGGAERTKHFSFSNSPTEKDYIEFTKKITGSDYSKALDGLKPGDWARLKMPLGSFTYEGDIKKIAFLAGGIGITPVRSICKYAVDTASGADITLLYGSRSAGYIIFKEDFDSMQNEFSGLRVSYLVSEPDDGWHGRTGRIDAKVIKEEIPDYAERRFYICGPPSMVDAMDKILAEELYLPREMIVIEKFTGY